MRVSLSILLTHVLLFVGCSAGTSQSEGTTPEPTDTTVEDGSTGAAGTDDTRQRALEAASAFAAALGPVLATVPEDRIFEACERANELLMRANEMSNVGVPDGVSDGDAYREELARLPTATNMMATYCGRGVETVPPELWVSAELTFYRLLFQLDPSIGAPSSDESSHVAAARAVREALEPVIAAHREDRVARLCERIEQLVPLVESLESEGTPSGIPSSRHYTEELTRLVTTARTTATQCGEGAESVSSDPTVSIEVTVDRLWLMLHRRWPGAR